jgi:regulatory protein
MIITSLSETNIINEIDLFIDKLFFCRLSIDTIAFFKIFNNKEISQDEIYEVIKFDIKSKLFNKAINFISIRPRSQQEIAQYFEKHIYKLINNFQNKIQITDPEMIIEETIDKLKSLNYINDGNFAKWIIESRVSTAGKSRKESMYELMQKGIDSKTAREYIETYYSENDEAEIIQKLLNKKYGDLSEILNDKNKKNKTISYFLRRGFSYSLVKEALNQSSN